MDKIREKILAMTDEELRVEVAKAKGYPYPYDKYRVPVPKPIMFTAPIDAQPIPDFRVEEREVPDYPHDITAAYELVREMNHNGWTVNVQSDYTGCTVYVTERGVIIGEPKMVVEYAETAPRAITRAYLAWNEERKK